MNRCLNAPKGLFFGLTALLMATTSLAPVPAAAQGLVREFPVAARRGTLEVTMPPNVLLNGQAERLSPGARIKNANNTIVMSASLVGQPVLVNYRRDPQGLIHEVWILNEAEARLKRPGSTSWRNFFFDSDDDKPNTENGQTPLRMQ